MAFSFPDPVGSFGVDFRSHSGRIDIGSGDALFRTSWTSAGQRSIHLYRDAGGLEVAVAPFARSMADVTAEVFERADFSSRVRTPRVGEVALLRNKKGYAAALEIVAIHLTPESDPGTFVRVNYRILPHGQTDFAAAFDDTSLPRLLAAVRQAEEALASLPPLEDAEETDSAPGIGHNMPPEEYSLTQEDLASVSKTLAELRTAAAAGDLPAEQVASAASALQAVSERVFAYVRSRLQMVEAGVYQAAGQLMLGLSAYLAFGGRLKDVTDLLGFIASKLLTGG